MEDDVDKLSKLLAAGGWLPVQMSGPERDAGLDAVFCSEYGLVGFVFAEKAGTIMSSWASCQTALAQRREEDPSGRLKDAYLVFLCDRIEETDWASLEGVVDNTHECRKICVSLEDAELETVLAELPFLCLRSWSGSGAESSGDKSSGIQDAGLPAELLEDLGTRSAETILSNLMAGKYKARKGGDEDQKDHA